MNNELYYQAPSDEVFEDVKNACMSVWDLFDDTYGYATEKKNRIKDMGNIQDNVIHMIAMFDFNNIDRVSSLLTKESRTAIRERLLSVNNEQYAKKF